ncbi:hypothetical protein JX266_008118 [Neoarthrinium moseri]|nr:hypothetical protein JX266_008118 [Neoarthrinium moseri]
MEDGAAAPLPTLEPISRPSSTATTASEAIAQLPGISALATGASTASSPQQRSVKHRASSRSHASGNATHGFDFAACNGANGDRKSVHSTILATLFPLVHPHKPQAGSPTEQVQARARGPSRMAPAKDDGSWWWLRCKF